MSTETPSTSSLPRNFCPYKGLQPYTEADRAYFFGRDRDREIIISNLYASQLTVLYGASGVGKSSVLLAGVVPVLRRTPRLAIAVFRTWQAGFLEALKNETLIAVSAGANRSVEVPLDLPLDEFLLECAKALRGPIFFILDQFEEYFLYPTTEAESGFDAEFATTVNRRDINVNFMLCLREDGLSKLDRFQGRIPNLLSNMLRLEHLDRAAAIDAIRKPLIQYNKNVPAEMQMQVEDELVEALIAEVNPGKVTFNDEGQGLSGDTLRLKTLETKIETPLLQMVLTRLWNEELSSGSHLMRLETLTKLGGAKSIARTHLDNVMQQLSDTERANAAAVLRFMVTPAGTKIAQEANALASWANLPENTVQDTLTRLSAQDIRILRPLRLVGQPVRYEIFHDVLAAAVLDWRRRFDEQQALELGRRKEQERLQREQEENDRLRQREESRRLRKRATVLSLLLIITIGSTVLSFYLWRTARRATKMANSSRIAAHSSSITPSDPELGLLLAIEATTVFPTGEAINALRAGLLQAHTEFALRHKGEVRGAVVNKKGDLIATAALNDTVKIWNSKTGGLIRELQPQVESDKYKRGARKVDFSPDGKYLVAANWEGATARVWDVNSWEPVALIKVKLLPGKPENEMTVYSAAFSSDSNYLITTCDDTSPQVWKVGTWEQVGVLQGVVKELPPAEGVKTSPTPNEVVATDVVEKAPPKGHTSSVYCVAFSPDGKYVVTGGRGNAAWVWRVGDWTTVAKLSGHASPIYGVGFSRDSQFIVTASYDRTARVWTSETGLPIRTLNHPEAVYDASFSAVNDDIVTACWDHNVRIWKQELSPGGATVDWKVGSLFRGHSNWVFSSSFDPSGNYVVTGSVDKTARFWRTTDPTQLPETTDALLDIARKRVKRQLTEDELTKYVRN